MHLGCAQNKRFDMALYLSMPSYLDGSLIYTKTFFLCKASFCSRKQSGCSRSPTEEEARWFLTNECGGTGCVQPWPVEEALLEAPVGNKSWLMWNHMLCSLVFWFLLLCSLTHTHTHKLCALTFFKKNPWNIHQHLLTGDKMRCTNFCQLFVPDRTISRWIGAQSGPHTTGGGLRVCVWTHTLFWYLTINQGTQSLQLIVR